MHNAALRAVGLTGWRYQRLPVPPELFEETVRALPGAGFVGANVTIPHKEAALALADEATDAARAIGAANTLTFAARRRDRGRQHRRARASSTRSATAARAARSSSARAARRGPSSRRWRRSGAAVAVWNRTPERARALAAELGVRGGRRAGARRAARQLHVGRAHRSVEHVQGSARERRCPR